MNQFNNQAQPPKPKKPKLELKPTDKEGLRVGIMKNGKPYSVRNDRSRYFYPQEWLNFLEQIKPEKQAIYDVLINTGARIDEALHIRPKDFDWERNNLTLVFVKVKSAKGETTGKPRTFKISSQFAKRMKKHIAKNKIGMDESLFKVSQKAVYLMFKRGVRNAGLKEWEFSLHNCRKSHGNFLKALMRYSDQISEAEICLRLGHTIDTYLKYYGSPSVFNEQDISLMIKILGDVYGLR